MQQNNLAIAESYYKSIGMKDIASISQYLHPAVECIGPLASLQGRDAVIEATKNFTNLFNTLTIRAKFSSDDQVMILYDLDVPAPIGIFCVAALLTFRDNLIAKIELIYDARPFEKKKEEIFTS